MHALSSSLERGGGSAQSYISRLEKRIIARMKKDIMRWG